MIDFLSNPNWINPQIDVLLFLQNIRIGHFENFDKFFLSVTVLGEFWLPTLLCAIVYWCIDFRAGVYLFTLESLNVLTVHFFKMIAGVYRPWVLDSRMNPSELAIPYAKGYSFPSGHSAMSSSVLGGLAYLLRHKKTLCISLIGLILLVGFSRLWLGVHTPQDVIVGLSIGLIFVFAGNKIIYWAEENKNRYYYLIGIINTLAVLALIYVLNFVSYRMDYVNGELLVNPAKYKYLICVIYSFILGIFNGTVFCRLFCPFNPKEVSVKIRVFRGIIGAIILTLFLKVALKHIIMNVMALKFAVPIMFGMGIFITLFYPIIFVSFEKLIKK